METTNSDAPELSRIFAPMLSELEDHATRLTARQAELARELAGVDEELARVEAVRAAMIGKATDRRTGYGRGRVFVPKGEAAERVEKIKAWARNQGEFRADEAADLLGVNIRSVGPVLAGMARRGELTARDDTGARIYSLV